ncbi:hypothetical protein AQUCO_02100009v1 [Aquilegia coerulea]|uniref:GRAM domain-containing protein n=1 Tax=Aquilegia coerulea TaxID=218851 RepID=A0A2G5DEH3_AQUCA|nr:hypothetical protein AQUCO_02100009v1 [Aquilegia coerulea]
MNTKPEESTHSPLTPPSTSIPPTQHQDQNTVPIEKISSSSSPSSTSIPPTQHQDQNTVPIENFSSSPSSTSIPPTQHQDQNTVPSSTTTTTQDPKTEKWGTHIMGPPAAPSSHPNNQKAAALWTAEEHNEPQHPYVQYSLNVSVVSGCYFAVKTGSSVSEAVYGKVGLTTKVLTGGGFESLYKQTFNVIDPNEKLKKTFACYLSTSTGPVAGTLYLTNIHVAFCSDRPLSFPAPSGQVAWSYYKVMIPLAKISSINPINMKDNPPERYIQIATVDNHDFWFMGFVNYDKASLHLSQSISGSGFVTDTAHPI